MVRKKKPYFKNYWHQYKNAPDEWFQPVPFIDFVEMKLTAWDLPRKVCCMIRVTDSETKKTHEYIYQREHAARNKVQKLMKTPGIEFTVCTPQSISFITDNPDATDYGTDHGWQGHEPRDF